MGAVVEYVGAVRLDGPLDCQDYILYLGHLGTRIKK